jgi:hypothetical protein
VITYVILPSFMTLLFLLHDIQLDSPLLGPSLSEDQNSDRDGGRGGCGDEETSGSSADPGYEHSVVSGSFIDGPLRYMKLTTTRAYMKFLSITAYEYIKPDVNPISDTHGWAQMCN